MTTHDHSDADGAWLATLTVLYVEDDATTRELLSHFLRRRVGRLVIATDGAEGLERFRAERPAMVVTDLQMPKLDGLAMAEEIRRLDANVPIVIATAFEEIGYLRRSIDADVDRYVTKPIDADKLDAALRACARRLRAEAALAREREGKLESLRAHEREALGLLAGGMAHDFNNLLQVVLGNVSLAASLAKPGTDLRELIDEALVSTQHASELGHQLRTLADGAFAQLRARRVEPTLRAVLAGELANWRTRLKLDLPHDLPAVAHDAELLGRAFGQLTRNALEAMAGEGVLSVGGAVRQLADGEVAPLPAGAYLALTFRDTGPGLTPEVHARAFDAYFSTKPRGGVRGMGLGLALCLAIVRKHGGLVTAESPPGGGALFTVLLPALPPEATA